MTVESRIKAIKLIEKLKHNEDLGKFISVRMVEKSKKDLKKEKSFGCVYRKQEK